MSATCRSRSKFGRCGRPGGHDVPHAVPVGDDVWFGYLTTKTTSQGLGYGKFSGGTFQPFPSARRADTTPTPGGTKP